MAWWNMKIILIPFITSLVVSCEKKAGQRDGEGSLQANPEKYVQRPVHTPIHQANTWLTILQKKKHQLNRFADIASRESNKLIQSKINRQENRLTRSLGNQSVCVKSWGKGRGKACHKLLELKAAHESILMLLSEKKSIVGHSNRRVTSASNRSAPPPDLASFSEQELKAWLDQQEQNMRDAAFRSAENEFEQDFKEKSIWSIDQYKDHPAIAANKEAYGLVIATWQLYLAAANRFPSDDELGIALRFVSAGYTFTQLADLVAEDRLARYMVSNKNIKCLERATEIFNSGHTNDVVFSENACEVERRRIFLSH